MTITENKINKLFEELVPCSGKADTVAGEIIRAISRIAYRNYNDGDHIGFGYGKETCNPAARYLLKFKDKKIDRAISNLWGVYSDEVYDKRLVVLETAVLEYIEEHPELKTTPNSDDMWDFRDEYEDVDDYEDEDDYEEDYDYEDEEDW